MRIILDRLVEIVRIYFINILVPSFPPLFFEALPIFFFLFQEKPSNVGHVYTEQRQSSLYLPRSLAPLIVHRVAHTAFCQQ